MLRHCFHTLRLNECALVQGWAADQTSEWAQVDLPFQGDWLFHAPLDGFGKDLILQT